MNSTDTLVETFVRLSALPPEERAAELVAIRGKNSALADELESLLVAHDAAPDFLDRLDAEGAISLLHEDERLLMPETAGNYRLIREIGRGGLGVVYLAERIGGDFEQRVAIKLIKHGMDSEAILRRFHNERRIVASLEHDNIARLIDGGLLDDGRPWFAMEYIEGEPVTAWCDSHRLNTDQRLKLFQQVCRAVQYAHSRLIIHRDLKPENILVTGEGVIKLLDFGIAKLLAKDEDGPGQLTLAGGQALTPEYAAPEQIRGEPVSVETDVYALGVVLYQLLTGLRPFGKSECTRDQLADAVCNTTPPLPSRAAMSAGISAVKARAIPRPKLLRRQLRGDLDSIVLTAMAREAGRRYGSVEALTEDVHRYLSHVPVRARRRTVMYRSARFLARHHIGVMTTAAVMLALAGGLSVALWQAAKAREQADIALQSRDFVVSLLRETNPARSEEGVELRAVDLLRHAADRVETSEDISRSLQARLRIVLAEALLDLGAPDQALPLAERGMHQLRTLHGPDTHELADGLYALARVNSHLGLSEQAMQAASEGIIILNELSLPPDLLRVRLLGIQAKANNLMGRYEEALRLRKQILEARAAIVGANDPRMASAYYNLATSFYLAQDHVAAEQHYREAGRRLLLEADKEHPRMSYVHLGIGTALMDQGRLEEAEAELLEAERIGQMRFGLESAYYSTVQYQLGRLHRYQGRYQAAREMLQRSAELAAGLGMRQQEAKGRLMLGLVLLTLDEPDAAYDNLTVALERMKQAGNQSDPGYQIARTAVALVKARRGQLEEALSIADSAVIALKENGHDVGFRLAEVSELYAAIAAQAGDGTKAWEWQQRARETMSSTLGADHPRTLAVGKLYVGAGGTADAL